jgi:hypothetical protein
MKAYLMLIRTKSSLISCVLCIGKKSANYIPGDMWEILCKSKGRFSAIGIINGIVIARTEASETMCPIHEFGLVYFPAVRSMTKFFVRCVNFAYI